MTNTRKTTVRRPFQIQARAGRNVRPTDETILSDVSRRLRDRGVTVIDSLWARIPGSLNFFAIAYEFDPARKTAVPFGCARVCFLRNGEVTVKVMGTKDGEGTNVRFDDEVKWK